MIQISCGSKTVKYHLAINCFHFVFLFSDKFDHKQGDPPTKPTGSPAAEKFEVDAVFTQLVEQLGIGVQPLFLYSSIDTLKRGNFLDTCKCFSMELSRYQSSLALLDELPNKRDNSKRPLQKEIAAMNIEVEELAQKIAPCHQLNECSCCKSIRNNIARRNIYDSARKCNNLLKPSKGA